MWDGSQSHGSNSAEALEFVTQRNYFQIPWAVGPVVFPTDYDIAAFGIMPVVAEVAALKLEFDGDGLPPAGADAPAGFAIGVGGAEGFDVEAEVPGEFSEEEDDAGFVHGGVADALQVERFAVDGAAGDGPGDGGGRRCFYAGTRAHPAGLAPGERAGTAEPGAGVAEGGYVHPLAFAFCKALKGAGDAGPWTEPQ